MPQASQEQRTNNNATTHESSVSSDSLKQRRTRNCEPSDDDDVAYNPRSSTETIAGTQSLTSLFGSSRKFESLEQKGGAGISNPSLLESRNYKSGRLLGCLSTGWLKKPGRSRDASYRSQSARMAVEVDEDHHRPAGMKYKGLSWRREKVKALEREVAMLVNRLSNEEDVHEVLERAHKLDPGSAISIPSFVPPQVKQVLMELGKVNEEIMRLEGQISRLQTALTLEQEMNRDPKSRDRQRKNNNSFPNSLPDDDSGDASSKGSVTPKRVSFEAKTLHFISKALKGDFTVKNDSSFMGVGLSYCATKENESGESTCLRRNGPWQKPPVSPSQGSPRLQLTPKREGDKRSSFDQMPKSSPGSTDTDDHNRQKPPSPNKLSESIMKCLIFIYVRLLRTTRQNELEKSGGAAALRSVHSSSISSRSFRGDPAASLKAIQNPQKDSRQQDPYGIFDVEESIPRDIGPYKNLIVFGSNSLDLKYISSASFAPLLKNLRGLLNNLRKVDLGSLTQNQKLAFWINMYNACVMHGFLQLGVPCSPEKLLNLMNEATLNISGNVLNAQAMENFILRKPSSSSQTKDSKEVAARQLYGLETYDPNVTFALCCGTRSSPSVKIYTADGVISELEKSKLEYLQASIMVTSTGKIAIPELLLKHMKDFAQDKESLVKWVCDQLPVSGLLRKSMVDCYRGQKLSAVVEKICYDFEFQYMFASISTPY